MEGSTGEVVAVRRTWGILRHGMTWSWNSWNAPKDVCNMVVSGLKTCMLCLNYQTAMETPAQQEMFQENFRLLAWGSPFFTTTRGQIIWMRHFSSYFSYQIFVCKSASWGGGGPTIDTACPSFVGTFDRDIGYGTIRHTDRNWSWRNWYGISLVCWCLPSSTMWQLRWEQVAKTMPPPQDARKVQPVFLAKGFGTPL